MFVSGVLRGPKKVLDYCGEFRCGAESLPSKFILDDEIIPDVRNQGQVGSCVGFAITNIMQILNQVETGRRETFSAGYVYGKCRDENADHIGMYIDSALQYLIKTGSCFERDFPHNVEMPEIRQMVKNRPDLDEKAEPYHIKAYEVYGYAQKHKKYNAVKAALYQFKTPILADTNFPNGRHAVCIIGWNDDTQKFTIVNSWGKSWGKSGIGEIDYEILNRGYLLVDAKNSNAIMPFKDVAEDKWYYKAVQHAYNAGFMNGTSEDTFEPEQTLTRAELAQALVNFAKKIDDVKTDRGDSL